MEVICAIGLRRGPELMEQVAKLIGKEQILTLVHVIDPSLRPNLIHNPHSLRLPRQHFNTEQAVRMEKAEQVAAEAILKEAEAAATHFGYQSKMRLEKGYPERTLVQIAREMTNSLLILFARDMAISPPKGGPASIGHTARFVLDHATGPVLLLR